MKAIVITAFSMLFFVQAKAQVPAFDKMEMLYAQKHYKMVFRRANRLLDNPEYDYSWMPTYYKSLAMFQLSDDRFWSIRREDALEEAKNLFLEVKSASDGLKILNAHVYEISSLKSDLVARLEDYQRRGMIAEFENLQQTIEVVFHDVPLIDDEVKPKVEEELIVKNDETLEFTFDASNRDEVLAFAQGQLGTPYVWAGSTPQGFDCSGFTTYVYGAYNVSLPRRAVDQYDGAKRVKKKAVKKGDLVFFDNGSGVSHVGIIASDPGEELVMIHASTSKGIILTNIETSEYWSKRLVGFGSYF